MDETPPDIAFPLLPDSPHRIAHDLPSRFMLVDVRGRREGDIDGLIEMTRTALAEQGLIPVFVTDGLDFTVFRRARAVFESLPSIAESAQLAPDLDWRERQASLYALIRLKWDPMGEIDLSSAVVR